MYKDGRNYRRIWSIFCVYTIGVQYYLHAMRHWLVQGFLVWRHDPPPNSQCNPFQTSSRCCAVVTVHDFHLRPQIFYWVKVQAISRPSLEESYTMFCMPLLGQTGMANSVTQPHHWEWSIIFLHFSISGSNFFLLAISKWKEIEKRAW